MPSNPRVPKAEPRPTERGTLAIVAGERVERRGTSGETLLAESGLVGRSIERSVATKLVVDVERHCVEGRLCALPGPWRCEDQKELILRISWLMSRPILLEVIILPPSR